MPVIPIDDLDDPRVADYRGIPDPELLRRRGIFVAEGRLVVRTLLAGSPFRPRSLLLSPAAFEGLADVLAGRDDLPVYLAPAARVSAIAGFNFHRGCLAIGERPARRSPADLRLEAPACRVVVVIERLANADNVGGIFRNAAAFGACAVLVGPGCCDPLYRKAIRTSMGAVLRVPFARLEAWPHELETLRALGFTIIALTARDAVDIAEMDTRPHRPRRVALLLGAEGAGLSEAALAAADLRVRIAMTPGVDSLNVATAAGIALHRLAGD